MSKDTLDKIKKAQPYFKFAHKRYLFYIFATCVGLGMPFIEFGEKDGVNLFLMSFLHKRLELMGTVFSASELYVLPLLIFAFAGWVLFCTALGGRIWCGWGCPQTIMRTVYRDFLQGFIFGLRKAKNKQKPIKLDSLSYKIRFAACLFVWAIISLLISANLSWYFVDWKEWFSIIQGPIQDYPFVFFFWLALAGFIFIDVVIIQENFCKIVCPYARIQSVFFDKDTALVTYLEKRGNNKDGSRGARNFLGEIDKSGDCTNCLACVKICPTGIDIRNGLQLGCIECLECVDACQPIMARKNLPNLIAWTTQAKADGGKWRFVRPRSILYGLFIVAAVFGIVMLQGFKDDISLNINHSAKIYNINQQQSRIENGYFLLITNRSDRVRYFTIDVQSEQNISVLRPTNMIDIPAGGLVKKAIILSVPIDSLSEMGIDKQTEFTFNLNLFDTENPMEPVQSVESNFVVPPIK